MHFVNRIVSLPGCPPTGCIAVLGVLLVADPEHGDNPFLAQIWDIVPLKDNVSGSWTLIHLSPRNSKPYNLRTLNPG